MSTVTFTVSFFFSLALALPSAAALVLLSRTLIVILMAQNVSFNPTTARMRYPVLLRAIVAAVVIVIFNGLKKKQLKQTQPRRLLSVQIPSMASLGSSSSVRSSRSSMLPIIMFKAGCLDVAGLETVAMGGEPTT